MLPTAKYYDPGAAQKEDRLLTQPTKTATDESEMEIGGPSRPMSRKEAPPATHYPYNKYRWDVAVITVLKGPASSQPALPPPLGAATSPKYTIKEDSSRIWPSRG